MKWLICNELKGWKAWEVTWLLLACAVITALSIYWGDSLMGIISSTTGVACVICTGKGKLNAYVFGLINSVMYAEVLNRKITLHISNGKDISYYKKYIT